MLQESDSHAGSAISAGGENFLSAPLIISANESTLMKRKMFAQVDVPNEFDPPRRRMVSRDGGRRSLRNLLEEKVGRNTSFSYRLSLPMSVCLATRIPTQLHHCLSFSRGPRNCHLLLSCFPTHSNWVTSVFCGCQSKSGETPTKHEENKSKKSTASSESCIVRRTLI